MLTLFGVYRSRASRPLWLLGEIGMPFRHVPVIQAYRLADPQAADAPLNTASASFLAVNPQGEVPAMDDDGLVLSESLAITLYLARQYGGTFGPADPREDALMTQWSLVAATAVEPCALAILMAVADGRADTLEGRAEIDAAAEKLHRPFARIDGYLADHDWLVGSRFTVADINLAECIRYATGHAPLMAAYPRLSAWLARCQARPAFQDMWAARLAEPA